MSNVNVNTDIEVDFELTESEKDNLVRSYTILRNLSKIYGKMTQMKQRNL